MPYKDDAHRSKKKCKEGGIVSATNAIVHPLTMMITAVHTVVTLNNNQSIEKKWRRYPKRGRDPSVTKTKLESKQTILQWLDRGGR